MLPRTILILLCILILLPQGLFADSVYKWEDKAGVAHYSSRPGDAAAKPATLPEITRADVKISINPLQTCDKHGGINCQLGADSDGSAICYDGFKGAVTRYSFNCSSPKLRISDVSERDASGGFTVYVRNLASVAAAHAALIYKHGLDARQVKLDGPIEIAPFGLGEYKYSPAPIDQGQPKPTLAELEIDCANCPG